MRSSPISNSSPYYVSKPRQADLETLSRLIETGQVTPAVRRIYPLGDAPAAIRNLAEGHARGKTAIVAVLPVGDVAA
jgi:NADPH:quinone reductase-like Zn-dependent oxidoreductase